MSDIAAFCESVTRTVLYFRRDGSEYVNTQTGEHLYGGRVAFDCGHVTGWRPFGAARNVRRGDREICSACANEALANLATNEREAVA